MAGRFDEVPIEIGGKRYRFYMGTYGLRALEREVGQPWPQIFQRSIGDVGGFASLALPLLHAGLIFHHESMTVRQASLLLDELGIDKFAEIFAEALRGILPPESTGDRPPEPAAATNGTGTIASANG